MQRRIAGPMHDQIDNIRRLVANTATPDATGTWNVVAVPHGVRVNLTTKLHQDEALRTLVRSGYKVTQLRPARGVRSTHKTVLVTDWDGERMQASLESLRERLRALASALGQCPEHTIRIYEQYRMIDGLDRQSAARTTVQEVRTELIDTANGLAPSQTNSASVTA